MATNGGPGNGERFELKLGSKSIGITSKDLLSVLFVLGAFAGMWLSVQHLTTNQERGFAGLAQILEKQNAHQAILLDVVYQNRKEMMELLTRQDGMLHDQTVALREAVDAQTKTFHGMLEIINWNLGKEPAQHLPLGQHLPERR